jgi:hypothetical protein
VRTCRGRHRTDNCAFRGVKGRIENSQAAGAFTALLIISALTTPEKHIFTGLDASVFRTAKEKDKLLKDVDLKLILQVEQLRNPDARVVLDPMESGQLLSKYANSFQGISPADLPHYGRCFWEISEEDLKLPEWVFWQSTVTNHKLYGGRELLLLQNKDFMQAVEEGKAYIRGGGWEQCLGKTRHFS